MRKLPSRACKICSSTPSWAIETEVGCAKHVWLFSVAPDYDNQGISLFEFPCGDVSLPCPELNINLGPIISEKRERYPLFAAFGIGYASAGQGTSPHALVQSERNRVHPDGERNDDTLGGGDHIPRLLPIWTKYLNISQWLQ